MKILTINKKHFPNIVRTGQCGKFGTLHGGPMLSAILIKFSKWHAILITNYYSFDMDMLYKNCLSAKN